MLRRYLVVPAVVGTSDLTGPWSVPGSRRIVHLSDGRTVREEVTSWSRPQRFAYRVDGLTGPLGGLVSYATGSRDFAPGSSFRWTYTFHPRTPAALPVLWPFVRSMWAGYMRRCADRCVALAEAP